MATHAAYLLLKLNVKERPGVTLEGHWQELAGILYGAKVDIIYLSRRRDFELWSRGPIAKRQRETVQAWIEDQERAETES
jgi:hypothetical protein